MDVELKILNTAAELKSWFEQLLSEKSAARVPFSNNSAFQQKLRNGNFIVDPNKSLARHDAYGVGTLDVVGSEDGSDDGPKLGATEGVREITVDGFTVGRSLWILEGINDNDGFILGEELGEEVVLYYNLY